jgi:hypothetical protein
VVDKKATPTTYPLRPTAGSPGVSDTEGCARQRGAPPPGTPRPRRRSASCWGLTVSPSGTACSSFRRACARAEGGELAERGGVFRLFQLRDNRCELPCPHRRSPREYGDPATCFRVRGRSGLSSGEEQCPGPQRGPPPPQRLARFPAER